MVNAIKNNQFFLGIDTSCYTTSVAVVDNLGNIVFDQRKFLSVDSGQRGLRQSDMVYQHLKNLPEIFPEGFCGFSAVAASEKPRPQEDSYMPVFEVSKTIGRAVSSATKDCRYYPLTHQHGHIAAAMLGTKLPDSFLALHVSGGTTECLYVTKDSFDIINTVDFIAGYSDISAGQLIDRVGQNLNLSFPIGPKLEETANQAEKKDIVLKSVFKDNALSFSGAETQAFRYMKMGVEPAEIAYATEMCVARGLEKLLRFGFDMKACDTALVFGGVASNEHIRAHLTRRMGNHIAFGKKAFCTDNACGLALLAHKMKMAEDIDGNSD